MSAAAVAPRIGVCTEYQRLLGSCQRSLAAWQQRRTLADRDPLARLRSRQELKHLQDDYARAYALLENHEHFCQACEYISKVSGLDFESMSSALSHHYRIP